MLNCPNADMAASDRPIRCAALRTQRWDLCIHQFFCRRIGKYRMDEKAATCKFGKEEVK